MNVDRPAAVLLAALAATILTVAMPPLGGTAAAWAADQHPLAGRWTVTALAGKNTETPAGDITFQPGEGTISGATACNFFRGGFETEDAALTLTVGMMTRRACPGPAADHERGFLEAMAATRTFVIDTDRLRLTDTQGTVLAELNRTPDAALEGISHKIVSYLKNGGLYSISAERKATITFKNGQIEGDTGCRPFTASYTRTGDTLEIGVPKPAQTTAPCAEDLRDQDDAILAVLSKATTFDSSRNLIRLLEKPDGAAVLWITPETP